MPSKKTNEQFSRELLELQSRHIVMDPMPQLYQGTHHHYTWRCTVDGHTWTAPYVRVLRGHGCPVCGNTRASNTNTCSVEKFIHRLNERNASLPPISYLSGFVGMTKKASFQCDTCNHTWKALPKTIVRGSGCPNCKAHNNNERHTYTQEQFLQKIAERNVAAGDTITVVPGQIYSGYKSKIKFRCEHQHEWYTLPETIWNMVGGCPHCAGVVKRGAIHAFGEISKKHPTFTVTSKHGEQLGRREQVDMQCEFGHEWTTHYERLMGGSGCPHCFGNALMTHDQFVGKLIKITQTVLPQSTYQNSHEPIDVRCTICNHSWKPKPYNLLNGYGCPNCSRNNKFSKKALVWLRYMEATNNTLIQHANKGGEYRIPGTRYKCDGFCEETNTVYEFYGDYWHGNPEVYDHTSYNTHLNKSYGDLYSTTMAREATIRDMGYNVVSVWEQQFDKTMTDTFLGRVVKYLDIPGIKLTTHSQHMVRFDSASSVIFVVNINLPPETDNRTVLINNTLNAQSDKKVFVLFSDEIENSALVSAKINHYLHASTTPSRIHARQCEIRSCTKAEKRDLLAVNHIQGNDNSEIMYGAYYGGILVSAMTFSPPRTGIGVHKHKQGGEYELVRFCTNIHYRIPGIASKLLAHFKRNHQWTEIYSFADKRWSAGNMYHQLGFELVADNPPAYFYVIEGVRKHRWNYRKDVIKNTLPDYNPALTEYQNMQNHGYWRVWDCGTLKFSITHADHK